MAFVSAAGQVQSMSRPQFTAPARVQLSAGLSMDYLQIYRTQPAVRTVIAFLARNIAHIGVHVFERKGDSDRARVIDHPLAKLLARPNPWTTQYRFLDALATDFFIFDTAYWLKSKAADGTPALTRIPPSMVTPKGDNWLTPDAFEVKGSKATRLVPADQMLYFRGYGGDSDVGISPIESLRQSLRESWAGQEMREQIMNNGARSSGYLERPDSAPPWTTTAKDTFRREWRSQYVGSGGSEAGGTPILEDGMKFVEASQTAKDLQYVEGRRLSREEVASAYFVSPPMVGILDKATFSNIVELHKMLYQDTLGPPLAMIEDEIALQLVPEWDKTGKLYAEFNIREKLTASFEERSSSLQTAVGSPWLTVNEARALDNRSPLDGGDELVRPLNVTQNGDDNPVPAAPAITPDPADDEPADNEEDDENAA